MRMCSACEDGEHHDCGLQTWCECECDPYSCTCRDCHYEPPDDDRDGTDEGEMPTDYDMAEEDED